MTGVTLTMRGEQRDNHLLASYTVTNAVDNEPIFLLNQLGVGVTGFSSEISYVCWAEAGTALLLQGPGPRPANPLITFTQPDIPAATLVPSGRSFSSTIRAPVPLQEWSGHQPVITAGPFTPETIGRIVLRVAHLRDSAKFYAEEHRNFPGVFLVNGNPIEMVEARATLDQPCLLDRRQDDFVRFF